jgi:hypothetical protein
MRITRTPCRHADCVVCWHNPPLFEIVIYQIVPGGRNIF